MPAKDLTDRVNLGHGHQESGQSPTVVPMKGESFSAFLSQLYQNMMLESASIVLWVVICFESLDEVSK